MRASWKHLEGSRLRTGPLPSETGDRHGAFFLLTPRELGSARLKVIVSDGHDWDLAGLPGPPWEHVSVSCGNKDREHRVCPTWEEMCWVKDQFWEPEEAVVQFHPPRSKYVNHHPTTLHLWRVVGWSIPLPPPECVGPLKAEGVVDVRPRKPLPLE
jgi:hypothetical protein